jgi:hypothetical protein
VNSYEEFVAGKLALHLPTGIDDATVDSPHLFDFQRDLVTWALRRGRCALFTATGTGKSRMQVTWSDRIAKHTGMPVLVLAPLAVGPQTAEEGARIGIDVAQCRSATDVRPGVNVTNYEKLHLFDPGVFGGIALDESSCIKHFNSKTLAQLIAAFGRTSFKLACTATPSPNDYTELGTHAELLGVCSRVEMLSEFFVHDGGDTQTWRLKGHARKVFWAWVASWAALVRSPADLGYDASAYELPPLSIKHHTVESEVAAGQLFVTAAASLMERRSARKASLSARVERCAALVNGESSEPWVVWCNLNDESDALTRAIPGAVEIRGSNTEEERLERLQAFARGDARVIISKASVTGWGLNWQHCARMAFVGVDDSWESYHQAVRRCYRFGKNRPVNVHVFASEAEGAVVANLERKERDATAMGNELSAETAAVVRENVRGLSRTTNEYEPSKPMLVPEWCVSEEKVA